MADRFDKELRMNQIQVIGTHNSYHIAPDRDLLTKLQLLSKDLQNLDYTHRPLPQQLEEQNVRQLELDVYADPEGGLFSERLGPALIGKPTASEQPELDQPGFKVLHIPHIDYQTNCHTFLEGLELVRSWSQAHPDHVPVMILVEVKGALPAKLSEMAQAKYGRAFRPPIECERADLDALEQEIRSVFAEQHLVTPDHVRSGAPTLEEAILTNGWPTLKQARGRVLFCLDNTDRIRDIYLDGRESLLGRVLFPSAAPGKPYSAFIKYNNPIGDHEQIIRRYVKDGYLVRTMADPGWWGVRSGETAKRDAALRSGAHYVSTDYPLPGYENYAAALPGAEHKPARLNPVNGPDNLREEDVQWEEER